MREKRNALLVILIFAFFGWGFWAWFMAAPETPQLFYQRVASLVLFIATGMALFWALCCEDKLPDALGKYAGGLFYEQGGLCFIPVMRKDGEQAYIHIYFANRYENNCNAIVHLRPPPDSMQHRPDASDIHFSFSCPGGGVGVIQQPVAVHPRLQGSVVDVQLAAAVNYPHSQGDRLRSQKGLPCGTFHVDWGENFRTGMHELSGEIELLHPVTIHLPVPRNVTNRIRRGQQWRQQIFSKYEK
ncbi:MAG: hypothetical protein IT430_12495 [Phycisphaerales bacterium]|nr:hypothetical protein [Phycisphaerales bacterium]